MIVQFADLHSEVCVYRCWMESGNFGMLLVEEELNWD